MKHPSLTPDQITILGPANSAAVTAREVIQRFHEAFDRHDPGALEDLVGERVVIRWRYCWGDDDTQSIRGINLMRVRGGHIVEAMGYVKG